MHTYVDIRISICMFEKEYLINTFKIQLECADLILLFSLRSSLILALRRLINLSVSR